MPLSAYNTGLALDGDTVCLLSTNALYRLAPGKPPQKVALDLGTGPVFAPSGIFFWSKGAVWNATHDGSNVWRVAAVPTQPEYFVASDAGVAWLDRPANGPFRIQTVDGQRPRVLLSSEQDLSAVHMVHDGVFFVERAKDKSWRIGRVSIRGGDPVYTASRGGPTPAMLTGSDSVIYYDMDRSEVRQLTPDLKSENVWIQDFVCTPNYEAKDVYCARVEGLFAISAQNHQPKVLLQGRQTITAIRANAKHVAWIVDQGGENLAVDMLPVD
jgi:hypothetical protein